MQGFELATKLEGYNNAEQFHFISIHAQFKDFHFLI